jgi:hypothetical protein
MSIRDGVPFVNFALVTTRILQGARDGRQLALAAAILEARFAEA